MLGAFDKQKKKKRKRVQNSLFFCLTYRHISYFIFTRALYVNDGDDMPNWMLCAVMRAIRGRWDFLSPDQACLSTETFVASARLLTFGVWHQLLGVAIGVGYTWVY